MERHGVARRRRPSPWRRGARLDRGIDRAHRAAQRAQAARTREPRSRLTRDTVETGDRAIPAHVRSDDLWEILPEVVEGTRRGYRIIASHYPYAGDSQEQDRHTSHRPRWDDGIPLIHGHTHARDHGPNGHQFHVGVDAHDFSPVPFSVIDAWIQRLPGIETRLQTAVREAREVLADLDGTPPLNMDLMFFMQAYDELHMHLEELLAAVDEVGHLNGDEGEGSR